MNSSRRPFTPSFVSFVASTFATTALVTVKFADSVWPPTLTVTVPVYLPAATAVLPVIVNVPEGPLPVCAKSVLSVVGSPLTVTVNVPAGAVMLTGTTAAVPSCPTTTLAPTVTVSVTGGGGG